MMGNAMNLEALASAISHDMRSPPRRVQAFASLLRESLASAPGSDTAKLLDSVESNALETSAMLTDLLGLVRLAMAPIGLEALDLDKLVRAAWARACAAAPGFAHALKVGALPQVMGDRELIGIALEALLSNAAKFSANHASPAVELGSCPVESGVHIFVTDNGAGFDERNRGRLFRPFSRLHSAKDFAGRGMGLASVDLIVRRHGGRVWASSTPGQGARFDFTLPAAARA